MLRINLLIEKTVAIKHSDIFLRIMYNICKIKLTRKYFSYIYISYQMYKTGSCVTFHHPLNRIPLGDDNCISTSQKEVSPSAKHGARNSLKLWPPTVLVLLRPCNLAIFWALAYLEPEEHSKSYEIFTTHIQNLAIVRAVHSGIIQLYLSIFRTFCNACISRNLKYSESWNIQNPSIIASWSIFRTLFNLWE